MDEGKNCRNEIDKKCAARTELQMSDDDDGEKPASEKNGPLAGHRQNPE